MPTTFSQLVDTMVGETKRPDLKREIAAYLNQTMRELHFEPERNNAVLYSENYREAALTASTETGFGWTAPNPTTFQAPNAAQFVNVVRDGEPVWGVPVTPGAGMRGRPYNFYRAGTQVFFSGYGGLNAVINWSWYEYVPSLVYYDMAARPGTFDPATQSWTYAPAFDTDAASRQLAQDMTTNWMLMRWQEVIEEGLRAKIYKRVGDDQRARTSYSLYQSLRKGLVMAESVNNPGGMF